MFPDKTWCFDLEIINAIPDKGKQPEPGITYCKGWGDHAGMGISVLVAATVDGSQVEVFTAENLFGFSDLVRDSEFLVGHNSRGFDAKVLGAKGIYIPNNKHLDFYHEVKKSLGNGFPRGFKLNDVSARCGGPTKTEDGALAPYMWQRGEKQRVIDYCKNDILMTCHVAKWYAEHGAAIPGPDRVVFLRSPSQIKLED